MRNYVALVGTAGDVVTGEFCDLGVMGYEGEQGRAPFTAELEVLLSTRIDHPDKLGVVIPDAEAVLREHGWAVTSDWAVADDHLYADVERAR